MASIPCTFHTNANDNSGGSQTGLYTYLKAAGFPSGDTAILDANFGTNGYMRAKLTSGLHVVAECSLFGETLTVDVNAGSAIAAGSWYWLGVGFANGNAWNTVLHMRLCAQLWAAGGVSAGQQQAVFSGVQAGNGVVYAAQFGWGVATSSSYAPWPNSAGWELSKGMVRVDSNTYQNMNFTGPPSTDLSVDGAMTAYWSCRQAVGSAASILDATTNHYDLVAGSVGCTVVADGPYP